MAGLKMPTAWGVLLDGACPAEKTDLEAILLRLEAWLGATSPLLIGLGNEVGIAVVVSSDGRVPLAQGVRAEGWSGTIDQTYLLRWLARVAEAATTGTPTAKSNDPLPGARDNDAIAKLARWLLAGVRRLAPRPFSDDPRWANTRAARDWMAATALEGGLASEGTFLRAELARTDWK